ncbi:hypothetical protein K1719_022583 [Acacia pycnantha]|nr:hypothetical protein K1719_022583 [Acacia pycnantha]
MCSSGGEEYYDTVGPASLNSTNAQVGSFFSLISQSHQQNPNLFDPSPYYLHHALPQSQLPAASIPNSEANYCTHLPDPPIFSSSLFSGNQSVGGCRREAEHDHAVVRNSSKKQSRASRRAPTTVITTDPSNFRSMVREFTGIPAPPSSAASHSRRFHPFRRHLHPPNPSSPSSSSLNIITTAPNALASHQLLPDLGYDFQTPLHLPLPTTTVSSESQPSGSEWPLNATNSWSSRLHTSNNNGGGTREQFLP